MVIFPMSLSLEINSSGESWGYLCSPSSSSHDVSLMSGYPGFADMSWVNIIVLPDVTVSIKSHQAQLGDLGGCCQLLHAFPKVCGHQEGLFFCALSQSIQGCSFFSFPPFLTPFLFLQLILSFMFSLWKELLIIV